MNVPFLTRDHLQRLIASEGGPHLSLFLPPPNARNDTLEEEAIQLRNLLRSAQELLAQYWMPNSAASEFLQPLAQLHSELKEANPRTYSLACFVSSDTHNFFRVDKKLVEQLSIGRTFRIRPLLPCLEELDPYAVLTLSKERVALFAHQNAGLETVTRVVPESFEKIEAGLSVEPKTQARAAAIGGIAGQGTRQGVVFHGQGDVRDVEKVDLENYLKHVDHSVCSYFRQHSGTRLILAGVDSLTSMYRTISHCKNIVSPTVSGNVDHLSAEELHARVISSASGALHQQREQRATRIREQDSPVATDPEEILVAASEGRIDTLFIDRDATMHGFFIADDRALKEVHHAPTADPGDSSHDLIELAAVQTIKTGGTVYAVATNEMPVAKRMAAALRF